MFGWIVIGVVFVVAVIFGLKSHIATEEARDGGEPIGIGPLVDYGVSFMSWGLLFVLLFLQWVL